MVKKASVNKKPKPAASHAKPATTSGRATQQQSIIAQSSPRTQQRLLDIFSSAFSGVLSSSQFPTLLQEIKQALFNRDFAAAFGREDYLQAYAARWSPTRALCYSSVFQGIADYLHELEVSTDQTSHLQQGRSDQSKENESGSAGGETVAPAHLDGKDTRHLRMLSIGGCAAEHVAFAQYIRETNISGSLTLLDSASWSDVVSSVQTHLTTPPQLSKYVSEAVKASNSAFIQPSQLSVHFCQQDALDLDQERLTELLGPNPVVITILFTLNELYTNGGIGKATKFLSTLSQSLPNGSLLLVVDSPGSYSEAAVGKEKKRYPMQWLLDHTLLGTKVCGIKWDKLESHESVWCRLPEELSYPMQLENMRYQLHLYRLNQLPT